MMVRAVISLKTYPAGTVGVVATAGITYFVRTDGGDPVRCTGAADAPDPGAGVGMACAWDHPFRALPPAGPPRLGGGVEGCPIKINRYLDRSRPDGDQCHRYVGPRLVSEKVVLLGEIAGEFAETIRLVVSVKGRTEDEP